MSKTTVTPGPDPVHLMTIEMGAWCGATGPGNGRASSAWREVTCPACTAKRTEWLKSLAWDMLQVMPASSEALAFAVRAGRLGVTDERGRPLAMACAPGVDLDDDDEPEWDSADSNAYQAEQEREDGNGYPDSEREADALAYQRNGDDERDDQ